MSFETLPIIDSYLEFAPDNEIQLMVAGSDDVDLLEAGLKTSMPNGYREYVTTLGFGEYSDYIRVKLPFQILERYNEHRQQLEEYYFWEMGKDVLSKERAIECIEIADTNVGDSIIFHPDNPRELFVLPRHDDMLYRIGDDLYEAIEWLCTHHKSKTGGVGEDHEERFFVPWNKHSFERQRKRVSLANDWKPEIKISRQILKPQAKASKEVSALGLSSNKSPNYSYSISSDQFSDHGWKPFESEPPLSVYEAVSAARKELPRFVENAEKYEINRISLEKFGENIWVYMIFFNYHVFDAENTTHENFQMFVKMDGKIIEPVSR